MLRTILLLQGLIFMMFYIVSCNSEKNSSSEKEEIKAITFIGRMMQQIPPKGFQALRYFGLQ